MLRSIYDVSLRLRLDNSTWQGKGRSIRSYLNIWKDLKGGIALCTFDKHALYWHLLTLSLFHYTLAYLAVLSFQNAIL